MTPFLLLFFPFTIYYIIVIPNLYNFKSMLNLFFIGISCTYALFSIIRSKCIFDFSIIVVFLYLLIIILSSFFSLSFFYSIIYGSLYFPVILITYLTANQVVIHDKCPFKIIELLISICIVISLLCYLGLDSLYTVESGANRLHGVFSEPSTLASFCAMNIGCIFFVDGKKYYRLLLLILSLLCMILTGTRAGIVSSIGSLLFIYFIKYKAHWRSYLIIFFILLCGYVLYNYISIDIHDKSLSYLRTDSLENLSGRTYLWKKAIPKALTKPLGYGFCLGGAALIDTPALDEVLRFSFTGLSPAKHSLHSGYIQTLCDLGVLGLIIYLSIFIIGIYAAYKCVQNNIGFLYVYMFIYLSIMNITESLIMSPLSPNVVVFWLSWFALIFMKGKYIGQKNFTMLFDSYER